MREWIGGRKVIRLFWILVLTLSKYIYTYIIDTVKMKIKLFTMVKSEVDIIEHWIKYHGSIFGYRNLHIIDNYSDDGTYETLLKYTKDGVHVYRELDYRRKGDLMTKLINDQKEVDPYEVAIPMDIDEFIVYYDRTRNTLNPTHTCTYINQLLKTSEEEGVFKMNYVVSTINSGDHYGYKNAVLESFHGHYQDYGRLAKTFFNLNKWSGKLDHGNHYICTDYVLTDLVLVHYHCRNLDQMKKKVTSNVKGLGYEINKEKLQKLLEHHIIEGGHHVEHMIQILDNAFETDTCVNGEGRKDFVSLKPIIEYCSEL